jgi:hypothetical protein
MQYTSGQGRAIGPQGNMWILWLWHKGLPHQGEAWHVFVGVDIFQEMSKFASPDVNLKGHQFMHTACN